MNKFLDVAFSWKSIALLALSLATFVGISVTEAVSTNQWLINCYRDIYDEISWRVIARKTDTRWFFGMMQMKGGVRATVHFKDPAQPPISGFYDRKTHDHLYLSTLDVKTQTVTSVWIPDTSVMFVELRHPPETDNSAP